MAEGRIEARRGLREPVEARGAKGQEPVLAPSPITRQGASQKVLPQLGIESCL